MPFLLKPFLTTSSSPHISLCFTTMASHSHFHLLCFLLFFHFLFSHSQLTPNEQESVYLALESLNSHINWRSLYPDDLCFSPPHGIVCGFFPTITPSNDTVLIPHITELNFGFVSDSSQNPPCSLNSSFPYSVFSLPHLRKLFFYRCFTHRPISLEDQNLNWSSSDFEEIVFIENPSFSGSINGVLSSKFVNLRRVIIVGSNVSGGIPGEITVLPSLEEVRISRNYNLGGEIPANLGFLKNLKVLDLSYNGLKGTVPESLGKLQELLKLDLSYNHLVGRIPSELKGLKKIEFFDLGYNNFGNYGVPLFLGELHSLKEVHLSGNPLGGVIPEIWGNLRGILGIGLSGVGLKGNIPPSMGVFLENMSYIYLDNNKLEGTIPEKFGLLKHVQEMNFQNNQLSGRLPFSAKFAVKIGNKLKLKGNSGICVDKSVKKSVQRMGILGNLTVCNGTKISTVAPLNGSSSLSLSWFMVILVLGFWSFSLLGSLF